MTRAAGGSSHPAAERGAWAAWVTVLVVLAVCATIRLRLLEVPFERDEGEYAYGGQLLLDGVPPFRLHYNMKLPGAQMAYALAMTAFGESIAGARLGLLVANAVTSLLLFGLGRRLLGTLGGAGAVVVFAFLSLGTELLGLFGHATHFVTLAAVGGLWLFVTALERGRSAWFVGSGVVFGVAVLMKQPGVVYPAFALAALLARRLSARPRELRHAAYEGLALAAGVALPLAVVAVWLAAVGVFETFRFWVLDYGAAYGSALGAGAGAFNVRVTAGRVLPEAGVLWARAGLGLGLAATPAAGFLTAASCSPSLLSPSPAFVRASTSGGTTSCSRCRRRRCSPAGRSRRSSPLPAAPDARGLERWRPARCSRSVARRLCGRSALSSSGSRRSRSRGRSTAPIRSPSRSRSGAISARGRERRTASPSSAPSRRSTSTRAASP
jgi:hypothetical protein